MFFQRRKERKEELACSLMKLCKGLQYSKHHLYSWNGFLYSCSFLFQMLNPFLLQWAPFLLYIHSSPLKICLALHEDFCNTSHFCCPNLLLEACKQKQFGCPCSHNMHLLPPNIDLTPASLFYWSGFLHEPYSTPQQYRVPKGLSVSHHAALEFILHSAISVIF